MTILYQDFNNFHMQSFPKDKLFESTCVGYSNATNKDNAIMGMSVGTSDSDSASASTTTTTTVANKSNTTNNKAMGKRTGKRPGRKPAKIDERAKLERSRQSAKECRARKKLRYQYLEELVLNREKAVFSLRDELEMLKQWCIQLDKGNVPETLVKMIANEDMAKQKRQAEEMKRAAELQKQQREQQLQIQRVHQKDLPSTSSVFNISSNSSSSSSSSSTPSPPQVNINANSPRPSNPYPHHHHQSKMLISSQPPPPPYPGTQTRYGGLTRQMAFDESSSLPKGSHPPPPPPSHPRHHRPQQQQQQQPHATLSHSFTHGRVPQNVSQPQMNTPQQHMALSNTPTSLHGASPYHHNLQNMSYQFPSQPQPSTSSSSNTLELMDFSHQQIHPNEMASPIVSDVNIPVVTSADLDDIADFISSETTRNPHGQFTTASTPTNLFHGDPSSTNSPISTSRIRSLSNPVILGNQSQNPFFNSITLNPNHPPRRSASFTNRSFPSMDSLNAPSRKRHTTSDASLSTILEPNNNNTQVGLFSGIPITSSTLSDADSDSSEENPNISGLFQSSAQKRTLSDPHIHAVNKKAKSLDSELDTIITDSYFSLYNDRNDNQTSYNPITKLDNLTTVKCMGSTGTLNTASAASPFGYVPRNTDSPMTTSSGVTSPAPSCQSAHTSSSPAPLSSSFLEGSNSSSTLSSALMDHQNELQINTIPQISTPIDESILFATSSASTPMVCSETGLSATIFEDFSIPIMNSYLAGLDDDNFSLPSTPTTTPAIMLGAASYPTPSNPPNFLGAMMQQQIEPRIPPNSAGQMNVPSILEEISSEESA